LADAPNASSYAAFQALKKLYEQAMHGKAKWVIKCSPDIGDEFLQPRDDWQYIFDGLADWGDTEADIPIYGRVRVGRQEMHIGGWARLKWSKDRWELVRIVFDRGCPIGSVQNDNTYP